MMREGNDTWRSKPNEVVDHKVVDTGDIPRACGSNDPGIDTEGWPELDIKYPDLQSAKEELDAISRSTGLASVTDNVARPTGAASSDRQNLAFESRPRDLARLTPELGAEPRELGVQAAFDESRREQLESSVQDL